MSTAALSMTADRPKLLRPILVGGAIAGTLDHIAALISFGVNGSKYIAAALVGTQAIHWGVPAIILGTVLHFCIAFSAAAIYCLASRRLPFLREHFFVCGLFYGIAVYLVMNLVVLPLCALHFTGPYQLRGLLQGLLVHMFLIGLPIAYSLRKLS
jgi:hypothetical protein